MFKNILVPLDGSDLAEGVFPHVRTMAAAFGARVTLLHVSKAPSQTAVDPLDWHLHKAEAAAYLREQVQHLQTAGVPVDSRLLEGPVAERIVEYADQQQSDLIILSTHGAGGASDWNVSHIAQKVLQRGVTSILLVHAGQTRTGIAGQLRYRHILVPLDGSRRAECVLPVAARLAEQAEADLLLAHVTTRPVIFNRLTVTETEKAAGKWLIDHNRARAADYFEELAPRIHANVQTALPVGDSVALELHRLVADEAIDLVLFSAHGQTSHTQWVYGSVVSNFIANGSAPLLVVQDLPRLSEQQPHRQFTPRQALQGIPHGVSVIDNGQKRHPTSS
ncbi:MAG TPA: universal stress protein [Candidatus Sulfomarinibacteraceae bacterium]|nr:universal stress protein [Candidatus Sulfomarinibacteraceae bacterium]